MLRDRWDEIQVEQLGSDNVVVLDEDKVATLLRLTLSEALKKEAVQKLDERTARHFRTALFEVRFGSKDAFEPTAKRRSAANQ
jgi:hypothetical protein